MSILSTSDIVNLVQPYTMADEIRILELINQTERIVADSIPGAFVECGVWRGGSMMAVALTLLRSGVIDRDLILYDTFSGMTRPEEVDVSLFGESAIKSFENTKLDENSSNWCYASYSEVVFNMHATGYPMHNVLLVQGCVENTLPAKSPRQIALAHLDTDWYRSTKHELESLWPQVSPGGVVIVDDFGHWKGAKKATDEFLASGVTLREDPKPCGYTALVLVKA